LLDGKHKAIIITPVVATPATDQLLQTFNPFPPIMNLRLSSGLAAIVCISLASCYPYDEHASKKKTTKGPEKTATTPDQTKLKEEEKKKAAATEEMKKKEEAATGTTTATQPPANPTTTTPPADGPKPAEPKRTDYQFANKVPGKEGFVFSPYNNKVVDVRDIPSGTLVQDPTYPAAEKKYFRVP
jgi:hypothetical protein